MKYFLFYVVSGDETDIFSLNVDVPDEDDEDFLLFNAKQTTIATKTTHKTTPITTYNHHRLELVDSDWLFAA